MAYDERNFLRRNLTIDTALDVIAELEDNSGLSKGMLVKRKDYNNQVLFESENYFYKIYESPIEGAGSFVTEIRKAIAFEYEKLGINWELFTFVRGNQRYDFERREKLRVANEDDGQFGELFLSFSNILDKVECSLEFPHILSQLHENELFRDVADLKLLRCCVNKFDDYAYFNNQVVLLDDADFYIALVDLEGSPVRITNPRASLKIDLSYGNFVFRKLAVHYLNDGSNKLYDRQFDEVVNGWFLFQGEEEGTSPPRERNFSRNLKSDGNDMLLLENSESRISSRVHTDIQQGIRLIEHEDALGKMLLLKYPDFFGDGSESEGKKLNNDHDYTEEELLYHNNLGRRSFQWELWQCCNNLCKFCFLGKANRHTDKERQLKSLQDLLRALDSLDYKQYNAVSLIGGEFFQGQLADEDVRTLFFRVIDKLCDLYTTKKIGAIWITAALTLGDQADLYKTLDIFEEAGVRPLPQYGASGVWICTSWDPQGRFHSKKSEENWEFHMKNMDAYYPWIKKNTTIILTQKVCEMYLNGEFAPRDFMSKFRTLLFYKQPGFYESDAEGRNPDNYEDIGLNMDNVDDFLTFIKHKLQKEIGFDFFPERSTFMKFLIKYAKEDPDTYERLFNIKFRADELHKNYNQEFEEFAQIRDKESNLESDVETESLTNPNCLIEDTDDRHIINYAAYIDSNACMICDRNKVWEAVRGTRR